jgi:Chaperone of endosialidase
MKRIFLLFITALCAFSSMFAQLKVTTIGRVHAGNEIAVPYDPSNLLTQGLFGRGSDTYRAGSKLGFGDFGQAPSSVNVFIGEEGTADNDILQLHGKNGVSFSINGSGDYFVGRFTTDGKLHVRNLVVANSAIFSDLSLKKNIIPISELSATELLAKLRPVKYDWITTEYETELQKLKDAKPSTPKEIESVKKMEESFHLQIQESANHFGFIAQEVQQVYPNLVKENENGKLSVNYVELIPLLVQANQEKEAKIKALEASMQTIKEKDAQIIKAMEDRMIALEKAVVSLKGKK